MKLMSFKTTSPGLPGLLDILIRFRLDGRYSHNEIMFEPGDGVESLMPDGTLEPVNGAYWCASSVGTEKMPDYSPRRAGKLGGVRFKRIVPVDSDWDFVGLSSDPLFAARWAHEHQGSLYDWELILGYIAWFIPDKEYRFICSEACAAMMNIQEPWRIDPCVVHAVAESAFKKH